MRARIIALSALVLVAALSVTGLKIADNNLQQQFVAITPQLQQNPTATSPAETNATTGNTNTPINYDPIEPARDIATWQAENDYLMRDNVLRLGWGPELQAQTKPGNTPPDKNAEEQVTVLAVGDSFVWGQAVEDLDMRWPQILEQKLNQDSTHTYTVTALGRLPASLMQIADWLTPERLQQLNPDIVVIGYLNNDIVPTFEESTLCNQYGTCTQDGEMPVSWNPKNGSLVECLKGQDSFLGTIITTAITPTFPYVGRWLTNRYCDPDRLARGDNKLLEGAWIENPQASPYWPNMEEAIKRLGRNLQGTPTYIFDYWDMLNKPNGQRDIRDLLAQQGFGTTGRAATDTLLFATDNESVFNINPADGHPGPELTHAYAQDIADTIRKKVNSAPNQQPGIATASKPHIAPGKNQPAVSNYLPSTLTLTTTPTTFEAYGGPAGVEYFQPLQDPDSIFARWDVRQQTSCARIGRPHARIMLNPYLKDYTLTLNADNTTQPVLIIQVGYDKDGKHTQSQPHTLTANQTLTLDMNPHYRGILIATTQHGCDINNIKLPTFGISGTITPQ